MSWICAQLPQIFTNYKNKSAEGISPSFLLLWFMGDFLSFTSCLLNDVVLKFQIYLSLFFLCNDVALCFQYYYYNSVYPKRHASVYTPIGSGRSDDIEDVPKLDDGNSLVNSPILMNRQSSDNDNSMFHREAHTSSNGSYDSTSSSTLKTIVASTLVTGSNALPLIFRSDDEGVSSMESLGLFLAWCCTVVYMLSRCPQLWKNYKRKSVDGINSILFGAALVGNLTYTFSILTSCEFVLDGDKTGFFMKELPYILGSSGTCIFDLMYFYQRYLYRNAGTNTTQMNLENWDIEDGRSSSEHSTLM